MSAVANDCGYLFAPCADLSLSPLTEFDLDDLFMFLCCWSSMPSPLMRWDPREDGYAGASFICPIS